MRKPSGSGQLPLPSHLTAIVSRVMDFVRPFFRAFSLSLSLSLSIIPTKRPYLSGEQCRRTSRDDKNISRLLFGSEVISRTLFSRFLSYYYI